MAGLTFALPKGRILEQVLPLLDAAGLDVTPAVRAAGRKLMLDLPHGNRALLVKPSDVPTYVEHGVADVGVAGSDTLDEQQRDLYEPVDLEVGQCRLCVAAPVIRTARRDTDTLRVATKYPRLALAHYLAKGIRPEVIPLGGSVELGALTALADEIVDLVESGETLRQNGLREVETIMHVSSRLVVQPASLKLKASSIADLIATMRTATASRRASVA